MTWGVMLQLADAILALSEQDVPERPVGDIFAVPTIRGQRPRDMCFAASAVRPTNRARRKRCSAKRRRGSRRTSGSRGDPPDEGGDDPSGVVPQAGRNDSAAGRWKP